MKLIITILHDSLNEPVTQALIQADFRVTRIASTGGFLRQGSSTLMIGVDDKKVDQAIQVIRNTVNPSKDPTKKQATLFVINVEDFTQL
jgi:uncharacterized protein YaaQ